MSKKLFTVRPVGTKYNTYHPTFECKKEAKEHRASVNTIKADEDNKSHEIFDHVVSYGPDHRLFRIK